MELTRSTVTRLAEAYRDREPLYAVERQHLDILPEMFASGDFGRRDATWVVRWYHRRFLGEYPDAERRARETRFEENDFEAVRDAIAAVVDADDPGDRVERLCDLRGVDVPVASAFLMFLEPAAHVVVGEREWTVLHSADELDDPSPEDVTTQDYVRYLETCRTVADRLECDLWTLYRALWRLWKRRFGRVAGT